MTPGSKAILWSVVLVVLVVDLAMFMSALRRTNSPKLLWLIVSPTIAALAFGVIFIRDNLASKAFGAFILVVVIRYFRDSIAKTQNPGEGPETG